MWMRSIPERESLTVEFKSDQSCLPDRDLLATAVSLANTDGGDIYLGVEDDGDVTGIQPQHANPTGVIALIANRTNPPLSVRAHLLDEQGKQVLQVTVPRSMRPVATSDGQLQRRRLMADGAPQCVPFYPHEILQRQSQLGVLDYSSLPVEAATVNDLDPLERQRLRQMVERFGGDRYLLDLNDSELDGALALVKSQDGEQYPTVTGLLLLGKEAILRDKLPTHEVAFQVLDGTQVKVNDFYRWPLLKIFERVTEQFEVRNEEDEVQVGLFRVPIPRYDRRAFRESFVNAVAHRDYTQLGTVYVRLDDFGLSVSNPGGFVEGVTLNNLLVVEPKPRNPALADAMKRIGLAERTGRGVDLIYEGLLRYGRPEPDYSESSATTVKIRMSSADADPDFVKLIIEEERRGARFGVDALIIMSELRSQRRMDLHELSVATQKSEPAIRAVVERLVERGLVDGHGATRGRTYTLSSSVYRRVGLSAEYVRQVGFDRIQQEEMVLRYAREHGKVSRKDAMALCRLDEDQASLLLRQLSADGKLMMIRKGRNTHYIAM
jgi:ATP-dependent DNA helicase RecG